MSRRNRYVHPGFNILWKNGRYSGVNPTAAEFRKRAGVKPVKGVRCGVRKLTRHAARDGLCWEAYNRGTLKGLTARFATHAEAITHATRMAQIKAQIKRQKWRRKRSAEAVTGGVPSSPSGGRSYNSAASADKPETWA